MIIILIIINKTLIGYKQKKKIRKNIYAEFKLKMQTVLILGELNPKSHMTTND